MNRNNNNITRNDFLLIHKSINEGFSHKETKLKIYCYLPHPNVFVVNYITIPYDTRVEEKINIELDIETDQIQEGPVFWAITKYLHRRLIGDTDWEP